MKAVLLASVAAFAAAGVHAQALDDMGTLYPCQLPRAINGHTLECQTATSPYRVRLAGILAPDLDQAGGIEAREMLQRFAAQFDVVCRMLPERGIARCSSLPRTGPPLDLAEQMRKSQLVK